jgi:probable HAF family extracellular repeat protein
MCRIMFKSTKLFIIMTISYFCCASIVMAADPNPPQSLTKIHESLYNPSHNEPVTHAASDALAGPAFLAPVQYLVFDVMPADGNSFSKGYGINNLSQVVGRTYNVNDTTQEVEDQRALFWDFRTGSTSLSTLDGISGGWGINDTGMAIGFSTNSDGYQRAVRWNLDDQTVMDLGTLTNPTTMQSGDESYGYRGINNAHTVVGHAEIPNDDGDFTPFHGFIYDDTNGIRDLGTLNPDTTYMGGYSIAYDINDADVVVGMTNSTDWTFRPFVWTEQANMEELAIDTLRASGEWYAAVINESGLIGGHTIDGDSYYPYYWPSKDDAPIALTMPAAYPNGEIYGLNETGQMVGVMFNDTGDDRAFIFDSTNGVVDLNDRISAASGWELQAAIDINDLGQITGFGLTAGDRRAFLLTPNADADLDADIDGSDLSLLIQEIGTTGCSGSCAADFNDDDAVNHMDVALLAMVFGRT